MSIHTSYVGLIRKILKVFMRQGNQREREREKERKEGRILLSFSFFISQGFSGGK